MANIINGTDTGSGGLITTGDSSDELQLQTAETARVTLTNTAVVVNEDGNDVDFRVEGDTDANLLFVDASADAVGIGTNAPAAKLHITDSGNTTADGIRLTLGSEARDHNIYSAISTGRDLIIAPWRGLSINTGSGFTEGVLTLNGYEYITFGTGSSYTERIRVTDNGITFNGDTAAANALDDYEEGTWTATVTTSNNDATFTIGQTATGRYTKIGRLITFHVYIQPNVSNVGTGSLRITGLPFTNSGSYVAITNTHDTLSASTGQGYVFDSGTQIAFINANAINELPISGTGQKYAMVAGLYFAT